MQLEKGSNCPQHFDAGGREANIKRYAIIAAALFAVLALIVGGVILFHAGSNGPSTSEAVSEGDVSEQSTSNNGTSLTQDTATTSAQSNAAKSGDSGLKGGEDSKSQSSSSGATSASGNGGSVDAAENESKADNIADNSFIPVPDSSTDGGSSGGNSGGGSSDSSGGSSDSDKSDGGSSSGNSSDGDEGVWTGYY